MTLLNSTAPLLALLAPGLSVQGTEVEKLQALDAASDSRFGMSIAVSGDTAVIGAGYAEQQDFGAAYVFERGREGWLQTQRLQGSRANTYDRFGFEVALDGNLMAVGAPHYGSTGLCYVFERQDGVWVEQAALLPKDSHSIGYDLAISGETLLIGDWANNFLGIATGAAYVYERVDGLWTQTATLTASDAAFGSLFGDAVALHGDTAVVGAWASEVEFGGDELDNTGKVYVFERRGGLWQETQRLTALAPLEFSYFGHSLALGRDRLLVGAPGYDEERGAAYVFSRRPGGWQETALLEVPDAEPEQLWGEEVALSHRTAVLGAPYASSAGAAQTYRLQGSQWYAADRLEPSELSEWSAFGEELAFDGESLFVGASVYDDFTGAVYIFDAPSFGRSR